MEIDLAQAEWVVTGYCAREPRMIETFEKGLDPHPETGCLISNAPREFVVAEDKLIGHHTDPELIAELRKKLLINPKWFLPRTMSIRQAGKKGNHGLNYDEGYKTFALTNEIDEVEAKAIVDKYHSVYVRLRAWYDEIKEQLRRNMTLENCLGSKRIFRLAWGMPLLKAAYAFLPQSTVGDVGKKAFTRIYEDEWLQKDDRCIIGGTVHDSTVCAVEYTSVDELAEIITRAKNHHIIPLTYHNQTFTLRTDVKLGMNWGDMHQVGQVEDLRGLLDSILNPPSMGAGVERAAVQ